MKMNRSVVGWCFTMTGHIRTTRPARAAIAAVLALSATPLLAQEIAPAAAPAPAGTPPAFSLPATPPVAATPATPATPVFQPSAPVVQQTAPVDQRIAEARAAAEAEQASTRPQPRAAAPRAEATEAANSRTAAPAPVAARSASPAATPEEAAPPAPAPQQTAAQQAAPATPVAASQTAAPAPTQSARTDQALLWAMGGGALLLLGLGGAAMMRRRRPLEEDALAAPMAVDAPDAAPPADTARIRPAGVAPAMAGRGTRAEALASRPTDAVPADATLDAMVAASPSADNPFTTRVKRTRRARFLLAQREAALQPQPAPSTMRTGPAPAPADARPFSLSGCALAACLIPGARASLPRRSFRKSRCSMTDKINRIVLAFSGGLDTSVILKWLQQTYDCEVVTFTADLGQGEELEPARQKARLMGVKEEHIFIDDLREEFVKDYVFPMMRSNALYEGLYLLGTSIARPLIAKRQIEIAAPTPSAMARPARAMIRSASNWAIMPSRPTSR